MDRAHVLHPEEAAGTLPAPPAAGCLWHDAPLAALLKSGKFNGQKEAIWATANFTARGTVHWLIPPVHSGVLEPLIDLLTV